MSLAVILGDDTLNGPLVQVATFPHPQILGLPEGVKPGTSLAQKFARDDQKAMVAQIIEEINSGALYRGSWREGEIEIEGISHLIVTRFTIRVVCYVLFPPIDPDSDKPIAGTYMYDVWISGIDAGAAAFCITTEGRVVLVEQFKHSLRSKEQAIPRGTRKAGESFEECAIREAKEEAGVELTSASRIIDLGEIHPETGLTRQKPRIIALTDVIFDNRKTRRDRSESRLRAFSLKPQELADRINCGLIPCAFTGTALQRAQYRRLIPTVYAP